MECKRCHKECFESEISGGYCKECLEEIKASAKYEDAKVYNSNENSNFGLGLLTLIIIIIIILGFNGIKSIFVDTTSTAQSNSSENSIPTNLEIMSYAQTVLDNNLQNPKYSSLTKDYTIVSTNLRYKIEGNVTVNDNEEKFYMIIEFVDDTYKEYDLISLQVGSETIYKK